MGYEIDDTTTETQRTDFECGICDDCATPAWEPAPDDTTVQDNEDLTELGELECCVLLVHFEDTEPRAPPEEFEQYLFGDDPDIGRETESVSDYWEEVSYGQLTLTSGPEGVGGWYEIPVTEAEYENADQEYDLLWEEAVKAAQDAGFDFGAYDDPVLVAYRAGGDGPAWGGPGGDYSGVSFEGSTLMWTQPSISDMSIGVSCHELGHALGLPHAYNDGLDDLALMSGPGTWASPPSSLCAHEKNNIGPKGGYRIGWDGRSDWTGTTDIWLDDGESLSQPFIVPPASTVDENYRIWDGPRDDGSRYQVEYRNGGGVDRNLDSKGLAVYYYPASSGFDYPLGGTTTTPNGGAFQTAQADIRHPDAQTEFELDAVETRYGCVVCNDPPERSAPASNTRVYAIPIDLDNLPDGTAVNADGDTQIDARVAWNADGDDISLELVAPDGSTHQSEENDANFAVVRSSELGASGDEGGWKLQETLAGDGTVEYVQAVNHPRYEMATTTSVSDATFDGETLTATVAVSFGDGSAYDPGQFGAPSAAQFALEIGGQPVDSGNVSVTSEGDGTYTLTVTGVSPGDSDDLSVAYVDEKAGTTHTTTAASTTIEQVNDLSVSAGDLTVSPGGTGEISIDATAVTDLQIADLWTDWGVSIDDAGGADNTDMRVGQAGEAELTWNSRASSTTATLTITPPSDIYVGGTYAVEVTAEDGESSMTDIAIIEIS